MAEIAGRVVAHAGAACLRFRLGGEEVRGAYSMAAMTDPSHRGRGLFVAAARHLYARLERDGFAFVAGFSNRQSERLMTGPLGRTAIRPFPWAIRAARPSDLLRALWPTGRPVTPGPPAVRVERREGAVRVREIQLSEPGIVGVFDAIWARAAADVSVGCVRDGGFVDWRYGDRVDAGYRILVAERGDTPAAFLVYRTLRVLAVRAGFVLDLVVPAGEGAAAASLLRTAQAIARADHAAPLTALLPGGGPSRASLVDFGFRRVPERLHPHLIRFSVRGLGRFAGSRLLVSPEAWHLSWADLDGV